MIGTQKVVVKEIEKTCLGFPAQWEGVTDDDRAVYVRYRYGTLSVRVAAVGDHGEFAGVEGMVVYCEEIEGGYFGGLMNYSRLKELTGGLIQWPEEEKNKDYIVRREGELDEEANREYNERHPSHA